MVASIGHNTVYAPSSNANTNMEGLCCNMKMPLANDGALADDSPWLVKRGAKCGRKRVAGDGVRMRNVGARPGS